ncbi:Rab3 GTPase-activating protein catalytic subunit [Podochytrium sp. JEL0797]|nr:Rab3 GTPase-activating protein catalytic subunit [Podochytrium sp. JEL0797]
MSLPRDSESGRDSDDEVFEIVDYSLAGLFERIVHGVEQVVLGEMPLVSLAGLSIVMKAAGTQESLARWSGFNSYVVIAGTGGAACDWDREKMLLSAAQVALRNTAVMASRAICSCFSMCLLTSQQMPVFVATGSAWRNLYSGVMISPPSALLARSEWSQQPSKLAFSTATSNESPISCDPRDSVQSLLDKYSLDSVAVQTRFRMLHSPFIPSDHADLPGLDNLFRDRLRCGSASPGTDLHVTESSATCVYTYSLDFSRSGTNGYYYDPAAITITPSSLPVGSAIDPVSAIHLEAHFGYEICAIHMHNGAPLSGSDSLVWSLVAQPRRFTRRSVEDSARLGRLFLGMRDVLDAWEALLVSNGSQEQELDESVLVSDLVSANSMPDVDPQSAPQHHSSTLKSFGKTLVKSSIKRLAAASGVPQDGPSPVQQIQPAFHFTTLPAEIFTPSSTPDQHDAHLNSLIALSRAKFPHSAPFDSILWRLVRHVMLIHQSGDSFLHTVTRFWGAFCRDLRMRWDSAGFEDDFDTAWVEEIMHGGGDSGVIDLRGGLVVQKVCMLGYCLYRRRKLGSRREVAKLGGEISNKGDGGVRSTVVSPGAGQEEESLVTALGSRFLNAAIGHAGAWQDHMRHGIPISARKRGKQQQEQLQNQHFATSWNSDVSWEDFGTSAGKHQRHQSRDDDLSGATEYHDNDCFPAGELGELESPHSDNTADLFFDTLDFTDLPKAPTPATSASKLPKTHSPVRITQQTPTPNMNLAAKSLQRQSIASEISDDSSGIFVGTSANSSTQQPLELPPQQRFQRSNTATTTDSFIKLPNPTDSDPSLEILDPTAIEGAQCPHPSGLKLLSSGAPMNIPLCQESGLLTEDMIQEQEQILLSLGNGPEAAGIRARMQTGQLKSDMESFKAANAGAELEDFVRWHSPRDWIVDEEGAGGMGKLSERMGKGNLWHEVWAMAKRVPAAKQKPLFDCEKEEQIPSIRQQIPRLTSLLVGIGWGCGTPSEIDHALNEYVHLLNRIEYQLSVAQSLLYKLPMQFDLVDRLVAKIQDSEQDSEDDDGVVLLGCQQGKIVADVCGSLERKAVCDLLMDG